MSDTTVLRTRLKQLIIDSLSLEGMTPDDIDGYLYWYAWRSTVSRGTQSNPLVFMRYGLIVPPFQSS